jgi:hypothetical protein
MGFSAQHSRTCIQSPCRSDPPAIFERLARDGEQTVGVLTGHSGVSQRAVFKHLAVLKLAGLCATATRQLPGRKLRLAEICHRSGTGRGGAEMKTILVSRYHPLLVLLHSAPAK